MRIFRVLRIDGWISMVGQADWARTPKRRHVDTKENVMNGMEGRRGEGVTLFIMAPPGLLASPIFGFSSKNTNCRNLLEFPNGSIPIPSHLQQKYRVVQEKHFHKVRSIQNLWERGLEIAATLFEKQHTFLQRMSGMEALPIMENPLGWVKTNTTVPFSSLRDGR